MSVQVIDTLKPKNNGTFPIVDAEDVSCGSARLSDIVATMATQSDIEALQTAINGKADAADLTALEAEVDAKADSSALTTAAANLQAQIDELITPVTQDAEVQNARVGADGTSYATLKARLDAENNKITSNLASLNESLSEDQDVALTNPLPIGIVNPADLSVVGSASRYRHDTIAVLGGEKYLVTGYCYENAGSTYPAAFVYKSSDTSDVVSLLAEDNTGYTNASITIPDGYNRLVINTVYNSTDYPLKLVKRAFINVSAIDTAVDSINSELSQARKTFSNLDARLSADKNDLQSQIDTINDVLKEKKDVALTNPLPNGIVNPTDLSVVGSASRYTHDTVSVSGGDKYFVTAYCLGVTGFVYPAAFVYKSADTSDVVSLLDDANTGYTNEPIVIPEGYDRLVLNTVYQTTDYPLKLQYEEIVQINEFKEQINEVEEATENLDFELENAKRRIWNLESRDQFTFSEFDRPYFVFVHDDSNEFIVDAYNAFHSRNVPFGMATIVSQLDTEYDNHSVEEWIKLAIADGGEALTHWSGTLNDEVADSVWIEKYVKPKKVMRERGINSRGTILADNSTSQTLKGEYYSRLYYDYSDKCGKSNQYKIGRTLMSKYASLAAFITKLDADLATNGLYAYGFHGAGQNEAESWITEENLISIIDYIIAAGGVVTTYGYLFDNFGSSVLAEKVKALETAAE